MSWIFNIKNSWEKICDEWYQKFFPRQFDAKNIKLNNIFLPYLMDLLILLWILTLTPYRSGIGCKDLPKILLVQRISVTFPCCPSKIGEKIFLFNQQNLGQNWRTKMVLSLKFRITTFLLCLQRINVFLVSNSAFWIKEQRADRNYFESNVKTSQAR